MYIRQLFHLFPLLTWRSPFCSPIISQNIRQFASLLVQFSVASKLFIYLFLYLWASVHWPIDQLRMRCLPRSNLVKMQKESVDRCHQVCDAQLGLRIKMRCISLEVIIKFSILRILYCIFTLRISKLLEKILLFCLKCSVYHLFWVPMINHIFHRNGHWCCVYGTSVMEL